MTFKPLFHPKRLKARRWRRPPLEALLADRIHYACGKNVREGWLNVDGFDVTYPDGTISDDLMARIYPVDLSKRHPFPDNFFKFGFSENFLEHLTQAESLVFLMEAFRTLAPGGVLRLSFPGFEGVLWRHFSKPGFEGAAEGVKDAYTVWEHEHFYGRDSMLLVGRHIGFSRVEICEYRKSSHPELNNLESRDDLADLNLNVELTK